MTLAMHRGQAHARSPISSASRPNRPKRRLLVARVRDRQRELFEVVRVVAETGELLQPFLPPDFDERLTHKSPDHQRAVLPPAAVIQPHERVRGRRAGRLSSRGGHLRRSSRRWRGWRPRPLRAGLARRPARRGDVQAARKLCASRLANVVLPLPTPPITKIRSCAAYFNRHRTPPERG